MSKSMGRVNTGSAFFVPTSWDSLVKVYAYSNAILLLTRASLRKLIIWFCYLEFLNTEDTGEICRILQRFQKPQDMKYGVNDLL